MTLFGTWQFLVWLFEDRRLIVLVSQRNVVFFRNQDITIEQQKELGRRLGELSGKPASSKLHIHPLTPEFSELGDQVTVITSERRQAYKGNDDISTRASRGWHVEYAFRSIVLIVVSPLRRLLVIMRSSRSILSPVNLVETPFGLPHMKRMTNSVLHINLSSKVSLLSTMQHTSKSLLIVLESLFVPLNVVPLITTVTHSLLSILLSAPIPSLAGKDCLSTEGTQLWWHLLILDSLNVLWNWQRTNPMTFSSTCSVMLLKITTSKSASNGTRMISLFGIIAAVTTVPRNIFLVYF